MVVVLHHAQVFAVEGAVKIAPIIALVRVVDVEADVEIVTNRFQNC